MVWNSNSPDGSKSVKANQPTMLENTTYIETTMNKDHFWNIGVDEDGRHNAINMPAQASDPTTSTGMDGTIYLKEVSATNARIEGFYRNTNGIYQFIPSFLSGTVTFTDTSTYVTIAAIPANSYGQVYLFADSAAAGAMQFGTFKSTATITSGYSSLYSALTPTILLARGSNATTLDLKGIASNTALLSTTYQYRIIYWGS